MTRRRSFSVCIAALVVFLLLSSTADAVTSFWNTNNNGTFLNDANWTIGSPEDNEAAGFDRGSGITYSVSFTKKVGNDITNERLVVGSNTVTFNPLGTPATSYFLDTANMGVNLRGIIVGEVNDDTAAVLVSHLPVLETAAATLGLNGSSNGTLTLNQDGDQFNVTGSSASESELLIGAIGTGVLNVANGADVYVSGAMGNVMLGDFPSAHGTANVSGSGSTLTIADTLTVGEEGTGTLNISAGGVVESDSSMLGKLTGSTGNATISGAESTLFAGPLTVGEAGTGTLHVSAGGYVQSGSSSLGKLAGSTGNATISGADSYWFNIGGLSVGQAGTATLDIQGSGMLEVAAGLSINAQSMVHLESGTLKVGSITGGTRLDWTGGTFHLAENDFIADTTGSTLGSSVTIGPAQTLIADDSHGFHRIGDAGTGVLTVSGGMAEFVADLVQVGRMSGSHGTITVQNNGTVEVVGILEVGADGVGELNVDAGTATIVSIFHIGGSVFGDGGSGNGSLNITNGGVVNSLFFCDIGRSLGSTGHANVSGLGSTWNTGRLTVGEEANGTLEITGGGHVATNSISEIGLLAGARGEVSVDGAGSSWTNGGHLYIGVQGEGRLDITNGGQVTASLATISPSSTLHVGNGSTFALSGGNTRYEYSDTFYENVSLFPGGAGVFTIINGGDEVAAPIGLGANSFTFYGDSASGANSLYASSNGLLTFMSGFTGSANFDLTSLPSQAAIAPLWDDWLKELGANSVLGKFEDLDNDGVNDRLIVQWNGVFHADASGESVTFQAILYLNTGVNDGTIVFNYHDLYTASVHDNGASATVGIKNANALGANKLLVSYNDPNNPLVGSLKAVQIRATGNLINQGLIEGDGTIVADHVLNQGLVSPGTSTGALSINGNYTQDTGGELLIELAADSYDRLLVTGQVILDGTVEVALVGGFMPGGGDDFDILDWDSFADDGYELILPLLDPANQWDISQFEVSGVIRVTGPPAQLGDYNRDGTVDADDYTVWRDALGNPVDDPYDGADGDGNEVIDEGDFDVWKQHFGEANSGGGGFAASYAIPEPTAAGLIGLALFSLLGLRKGRLPILADDSRSSRSSA